MTLSTPAELQAQFDALTARIAALDRDIALETDHERRSVAQAKRDELAHEREAVAGSIEMTQHGGRGPVNAPSIETRVSVIERDMRLLWRAIKPGPRRTLARFLCAILLIGLWSVWLVPETRQWLGANPVYAVAGSVALGLAAYSLLWMTEPQEADDDQR